MTPLIFRIYQLLDVQTLTNFITIRCAANKMNEQEDETNNEQEDKTNDEQEDKTETNE